MNVLRDLSLVTSATFYLLLSTSAFPQGSLTPPGPPGPTMQTLDQLGQKADQANSAITQANTKLDTLASKAEKRTAIDPSAAGFSLPYTIGTSGSYYLAGNVVATGTAFTITASNVTLDLNGFTISNVTSNASSGVFGVLISGTPHDITIRNGHIAGAVTYDGSSYSGNGFSSGLTFSGAPINVVVENVTVSGCIGRGIGIGNGVVRNCLVNIIGPGLGTGIEAEKVIDSTAEQCNSTGILVQSNGLAEHCVAVANRGNNIGANPNAHVAHCVVNNSVTGHGIFLSVQSSVHDSIAQGNQGDGIHATSSDLVAHCSADANGGAGINSQAQCTIIDSVANNNGGTGIIATDGNTVSRCVAAFNLTGGITTGRATIVEGCSVYKNSGVTGATATGITVSDSSVVQHNSVRENDGDAIRITAGCRAISNTCDYNGRQVTGSSGILVTGPQNRIEDNNVTSNLNAGFGLKITSGGNVIFKNTARGNTTNYSIVANNRYGTIVDLTAANPTVINGNSATSTASTDPWANVSY